MNKTPDTPLRSVLADPTDLTARLVYADYLDDAAGRPTPRARLIRGHVAVCEAGGCRCRGPGRRFSCPAHLAAIAAGLFVVESNTEDCAAVEVQAAVIKL